jgi:hypothetical protein
MPERKNYLPGFNKIKVKLIFHPDLISGVYLVMWFGN